jgi:hypothetical protein
MRVMLLGVGRRCARCLLLVTGCVILGVLGLRSVEARAATPSSLAGETFTSHEVKGSTVTGTCTGVGDNPGEGSFSFSVSGTAAGPFPGTFTESGSFSTARSGYLADFSSTFTITSPAGTVTGNKSLAEDSIGRTSCTRIEEGTIDVNTSNVATTYTATIPGVGQATGSATVGMQAVLNSQLFSFSEDFASIDVVQKHCKHGGWQSFGGVFKNQGDCVSFFASGRRNPPSGS